MYMTPRQIAKQNGDNTYEGKPCKNCESTTRLVSTAACRICALDKIKKWRLANPEKALYAVRNWSVKNKDKVNSYSENWRKNNKNYDKERKRKWRNSNPEKVKAWYTDNPERYRKTSANRRAQKLRATPHWADLEKIEEIYLNCPVDHHVDHIIPLKGKRDGKHVVCGLHVPHNLQYLTAAENLSKNCHTWPDM